ncbi:MAG: FHA domain-containing protein [Phycisphaerae bacterium]
MDVNLIMFRENGEQRGFPVRRAVTTVGRKDDCDIRIPVAEVSRHHSEFRVTNDRIEIRDLGSANGTYVNNKRVTKQGLDAGDHVVIGPVVFTVQIDGKPTDVRPVKTRLRTRATASADDSPLAPEAFDDELDPISALEALASSADQTALDPFDEEEEEEA